MDPERAREHLSRFYELSLDMIGIAGFDGYFKELGRAWETALGYSKEEILATPYLELVHADDRAATVSRSAGLTVGEAVVSFENRYRCRDGSYRWLEWNCIAYPEESLVYFVARDVTERRRLDVAREEAEERMRSLIESFPGIILSLDLELRVLALSQTIGDVTEAQVIGMSVFTFLPPAFHDMAKKAFEDTLRTGDPSFYETQAHAPNEEPRWYSTYVVARKRGGEIVGLTLSNTDITQRKEMEEELGRQARLLMEENAARMRVEGIVSRQQDALSALSTPIIRAWDGVLVLPIVGALDSLRAEQMMERLLAEIVRSRAAFAVLDLTGVEAVDTATVDHILRIVRAARLLGSQCIISGISPAIAQAVVSLGVSGTDFQTFGLLQDALRHAVLASGPSGAALFRGGAPGH